MGKDSKATNAEDAKRDTSLSEDDKLDDALDNTFPASDPPSMTEPIKHVGSSKKIGKPTQGEIPKAG
jgi:hypothetical protein